MRYTLPNGIQFGPRGDACDIGCTWVFGRVLIRPIPRRASDFDCNFQSGGSTTLGVGPADGTKSSADADLAESDRTGRP